MVREEKTIRDLLKILQLEAVYKNMLQDVEDKDIPVIEEYLKTIQKTQELLNDLFETIQEMRESKEKFKNSLQSMEKNLGENHPDVARCYSEMASFYERFGWLGNSLEFYLEAYKILVVRFGPYHVNTQAVYANIKKVYSQWNTEGNFDQWLKEKKKNSLDCRQIIT